MKQRIYILFLIAAKKQFAHQSFMPGRGSDEMNVRGSPHVRIRLVWNGMDRFEFITSVLVRKQPRPVLEIAISVRIIARAVIDLP